MTSTCCNERRDKNENEECSTVERRTNKENERRSGGDSSAGADITTVMLPECLLKKKKCRFREYWSDGDKSLCTIQPVKRHPKVLESALSPVLVPGTKIATTSKTTQSDKFSRKEIQ
uniref:Uncharacterized protein n=1 Tax=Loa loa TaxID=7209 RepID=A0A1I7VYM9_LOALO